MGMPIYMRIQQFIKAQIKSGEWPEESAIPTEAELSKQFGCSRITVTNALRELVKDGVIFRIQGKGTYVAKQNSAARLYQMGDLPQMAISLEAMSIPGEHKCVNRRVEKPNELVAASLGLHSEQLVIAFDRVKYVDGEVFAVERVFLPQLLCSPYFDTQSDAHLENQKSSDIFDACGITVGKSFISSQPVICDDDICALLEIPTQSPVLRFLIEIHDMQEHPVACELIFTKGRQERVQLT